VQGAAFLSARKAELPPAYVRSMSEIYACAVDADGRKVVDRRSLRT
jgi:hypothetical protein